MAHRKVKIHPYIFIILTFLGVILVGTVLLLLPWTMSNREQLPFVKALFMATSAVCVTGLSVVDVSGMTIYGKIVMALLMEIGGLSFITIAVYFFTIFGAKIGISNRYLIKEALNQNSLQEIIRLVQRIILISLIIQLFGTILNYLALMSSYHYDFWKTLGVSLFHSIASFNNAGFDVFGTNSMIDYKDNVLLNISTILLIVTGGLGFIVIDELIRKHSIKKLSIHSKIVLLMTGILIVFGMVSMKLSMYNEITWLQALFTSVTCRTAGFTTVNLSNVSTGAYITMILLMFVGSSPCSTGGGIKTTSLFVMLSTIFYYAHGKKPRIFKRRISDSSIFKAFVLFGMAVLVVLISTFIMGLIQPDVEVSALLYESISAFSTTGLSLGITSSLNSGCDIVLCLLMFFGRLGPLTIIGVVNKNWMTDSKENIQYVEERIIVG